MNQSIKRPFISIQKRFTVLSRVNAATLVANRQHIDFNEGDDHRIEKIIRCNACIFPGWIDGDITPTPSLLTSSRLASLPITLTWQEAEDYEGEDGGVFADGVHTQVDTGQDDTENEANQTNRNHRLHCMEPIWKSQENPSLHRDRYLQVIM